MVMKSKYGENNTILISGCHILMFCNGPQIYKAPFVFPCSPPDPFVTHKGAFGIHALKQLIFHLCFDNMQSLSPYESLPDPQVLLYIGYVFAKTTSG